MESRRVWKHYKTKNSSRKNICSRLGNLTNKIDKHTEQSFFKDILLYNTADGSFDSSMKVNAVIEYTGNVEYLPPVMLRSTCSIAIADFPFDEQKCSLKFGTWTYDESKLNLTVMSDSAQTDSFSPNGEWDLLSNFLLLTKYLIL